MYSVGRMTRSSKRKIATVEDSEYESSPSKKPSFPITLTPPPSQPPFETRKTRQSLRSSHIQDGLDGRHESTLDSSTSDLADDSLADEISGYTNYGECSSGVDFYTANIVSHSSNPFMYSVAQAEGEENESASHPSRRNSRDSNLDTPPATPNNRPSTPNIRPATPGQQHIDHLEDACSLIDSTSLTSYDPPPTPMAPPSVGNNLSSSLLVVLPLSSATTPETSAVPPINILESDDDNTEIDQVYSHNTTASPDINDPQNSPPPFSVMSKHSFRLRIKAPTRSRTVSRSKVGKLRNANSKVLNTTIKVCKGGNHEAILTASDQLTLISNAPSINKHEAPIASLPSSSMSPSSSTSPKPLFIHPPPKPLKNIGSMKQEKRKGPKVSSTTMPSSEICGNRKQRLASYGRDGRILKTILTNFMAHSKFELNWNPNVNIIHGPNGSGKSAIQTALLLAFGDRTSNSQRATRVQDLIKRGLPWAEIEVHLANNHGTLPKDTYGTTIILIRKIKRSGGSNYFFLGSDKQRRKSNADEAQMVMQKLHIYPSNPVQFLLQDRGGSGEKSKKALTPKAAYQMFMDATQLTYLKNEMEAGEVNTREMKDLMKHKQADLNYLVLKEKQLKKEYDQILKMEEFKDKLNDLTVELYWSYVKEKEDALNEMNGTKEKLVINIGDLEKRKDNIEMETKSYDDATQDNEEHISKMKKDLKDLKTETDEKVADLRKVQVEMNRIKHKKKTYESTIRTYQKKMTQERDEYTIDYEKQANSLRNEILGLERYCEEKKGELLQLSDRRDTVYKVRKEYMEKEDACKAEIKELQARLNKTAKTNNMDKFGIQMKTVLEKINCTTWERRPVGPLGAYISVADKEYGPLIESILYAHLRLFVVSTSTDWNKLYSIISEVYDSDDSGNSRGRGRVNHANRPSIVNIPALNLNNYTAKLNETKKSLSRFSTVLSKLTISDKVAEIGLIEATGCERILLFRDFKAAAMVMKDTTKVPLEVSCAFTLDWYKVTHRPNYGFIAQRVRTGTSILTTGPTSNQNDVQEIQAKIANLHETMKTCHLQVWGEMSGRRKDPNCLDEQLRSLDTHKAQLMQELSVTDSKKRKSEITLQHIPSPNQEKEEETDVAAQIEARQQEIMEIDNQMGKWAAEEAQLTKEVKEKSNWIANAEKEVAKLQADKYNADKMTKSVKIELANCDSELHNCRSQLHKLTIMAEAKEKERKLKEKEALAFGKRPKMISKSAEDLKRKVEEQTNYLDNNKDKLKSKKRIFEEYTSSKKVVDEISLQIGWSNDIHRAIESLIKVARTVYEKTKQDQGALLISNYQMLATNHKLSGKAVIDWEQKTLDYFVAADQGSEEYAEQNYDKKDGETFVRDKQGASNYYGNLSGGEKNSALVFFIMAVWQITDLPVHILDEFETCMDENNRANVHRTILQHAKFHSDSQFTCITPQSLEGIPKNDPMVSIHRLRKVG